MTQEEYAAFVAGDWRETRHSRPPEGEWVFWWCPSGEEILHGARTGGWVHGHGWDYGLEDLSHWRRIAPPQSAKERP